MFSIPKFLSFAQSTLCQIFTLRGNLCKKLLATLNRLLGREGTPGRHEPPHADTSLVDLLGRPSLRHAVKASSMQ